MLGGLIVERLLGLVAFGRAGLVQTLYAFIDAGKPGRLRVSQTGIPVFALEKHLLLFLFYFVPQAAGVGLLI